MKNCFKSYLLVSLLAFFEGFLNPLAAQTFKTLYSFSRLEPAFTNLYGFSYTNANGAYPRCRLVVSGTTIFGTAYSGGNDDGESGVGTIFKLNTDGTGFAVLHAFEPLQQTNSNSVYTNADGAKPNGLLLLSNTLYGTAYNGGITGNGTVFSIDTDASNFRVLHTFAEWTNHIPGVYPMEGAQPMGDLVWYGGMIYGTTYGGGEQLNGTIFAINPDGNGFTNVFSFHPYSSLGSFTGFTGANPSGKLTVAEGGLYGTTWNGVNNPSMPTSAGTVFGGFGSNAGFTNVYQFFNPNLTGGFPHDGLTSFSNTLYGTAADYGVFGNGSLFSVNVNGSGFNVLHSFSKATSTNSSRAYINEDGMNSQATLLVVGSRLYGVAAGGGAQGAGTLFSLNINGQDFTTLYAFSPVTNVSYNFSTNLDGAAPLGALTIAGKTLYGTTGYAGPYGSGTIFSLTLPVSAPQLTITPLEQNVILSWPPNDASFVLQWTTNLLSGIWTTNSLAPVVRNGQFTVTNPISMMQQFFRLSQ